MSLVTILMPVYKGMEFLDEAIASLESQSFRHWELLIGVNGYWRESHIFHDALRRENRRIRALDVFQTQGKAQTLNVMATHAQTEHLALLDVDDRWHPRKLQMQWHYAMDYDVVGTGAQYFGELSGQPDLPYGVLEPGVFAVINPVINSSSLFRRTDAQWDSSFEGVEDYEMWSRLAWQGKRFFNVPAPLTYHRIHSGSAFNTKRHDEKIARIHERYHQS